MTLRIGIDVGGTNTDAVVLDGRTVVAATKSRTTADVTSGILAALNEVLSEVDRAAVSSVFLGTTHFINAIAQATGLSKVAAVRIATPPQTLVPMTDWPAKLHDAVCGQIHVCAGGSQFNGKLLASLDEEGLRSAAAQIREAGLTAVALSSVFSSVNPEPELRAEEILREELPDARITRSSLVGRVGILERENATILNAALLDLAAHVIDSLQKVIADAGLEAPILLSQNDGTVMTLDRAREFPIFTIASGPTNSMRGAALLTGINDAVVVDVGGTTTDIGMLQHGFPRESTVAMSLAGVRSNFRIPDVLSLALGGGSIVTDDGASVGPESVGYRLVDDALAFGGSTTTFTDIAVAAGLRGVGDADLVASIPDSTVGAAMTAVSALVAQAVDKAKLTSEDIPVVAVGGGAVLLADVPGLDHLIIPDNAGVANAVGAAFAEAGGEIDRVFMLDGVTRADVLVKAREEAIALAVEAGADPDAVRIITSEDVPLTHLPGGGAVHVRVKAVGPFRSLALTSKGN